jgi:diaminopimelate epimerase
MTIPFEKYQGAGNDFIIVDCFADGNWVENPVAIRKLCDRRFGIGADGLMVVLPSSEEEFSMLYYNSDGFRGTLCGNGGRCISAWAFRKGIASRSVRFSASGIIQQAEVHENGTVSLKMPDVLKVDSLADGTFMDTGSPHFVKFVDDPFSIDVNSEGKILRNESRFGEDGANINFVSVRNNIISITTFERGVEAETLACGTGSVAAAIACGMNLPENRVSFEILARGGKLHVSYSKNAGGATDIVLTGPAEFVFHGTIEI